MHATCIASSGSSVPDSCLDEQLGITRDTEFPLTVGQVYVVYGITMFHGQCWYYVFDDNELPYPVWELAPLFDISDPSLPADWIVSYVKTKREAEGFLFISFPEWALDHSFYERLVDGDPSAVSTFEARRASAERHAGDLPQ